jgi:hypothetical protein
MMVTWYFVAFLGLFEDGVIPGPYRATAGFFALGGALELTVIRDNRIVKIEIPYC